MNQKHRVATSTRAQGESFKNRRARALEFQRQTTALGAEEFTKIDEGWLVRSRSLPLVWILNQVRVTQPIEFDEALGLASGCRKINASV